MLDDIHLTSCVFSTGRLQEDVKHNDLYENQCKSTSKYLINLRETHILTCHIKL